MFKMLTEEDLKVIRSKSAYWNEVRKRDPGCSGDILYFELMNECTRLGTKILFILEEAANLASTKDEDLCI